MCLFLYFRFSFIYFLFIFLLFISPLYHYTAILSSFVCRSFLTFSLFFHFLFLFSQTQLFCPIRFLLSSLALKITFETHAYQPVTNDIFQNVVAFFEQCTSNTATNLCEDSIVLNNQFSPFIPAEWRLALHIAICQTPWASDWAWKMSGELTIPHFNSFNWRLNAKFNHFALLANHKCICFARSAHTDRISWNLLD